MGGIVGSLAGGVMSLLGGGSAPKAPTPPPPPPPPAPMPDPDDEEIKKARRRKATEQQARSGRTSTLLTGSSGETLGG